MLRKPEFVITTGISVLLTTFVIGSVRSGAEADRPLTIQAFSVLPGEWIAYTDRPVKQAELDGFTGQYLLSGTWPKGVKGPDDPEILLSRDRLAASRIVGLKAESGGRRIRLTADPAVSPEPYRLNVGGIALEASFSGLAVNIGPAPVEDATHDAVLQKLTSRAGLAELASIDPYVRKIESAWNDPAQAVTFRGWIRLPEGEHKLRFEAGRAFVVSIAGADSTAGLIEDTFVVETMVESPGTELDFAWRFPSEKGPIRPGDTFLACSIVSPDGTRPLPADALLTPWAPEPMPDTPLAITPPPYELSGGDPERGRTVFESPAARCVSCHKIDGKGGLIGPDLSNLRGADAKLVFHHINAPSDRIHPAYPSFSIALRGGQVTMGVVRAVEIEMLDIFDTDARSQRVSSFDVTEMRPSSSSIMPAGLAGALGEAAMRDLIAFLTKSK